MNISTDSATGKMARSSPIRVQWSPGVLSSKLSLKVKVKLKHHKIWAPLQFRKNWHSSEATDRNLAKLASHTNDTGK